MMSVYFFTGIFFTLGFNAFLSQVADDFVTGVLSIVGGVISSVVVAWCKIDGNGNVPDDKGKGWLRLPLWGYNGVLPPPTPPCTGGEMGTRCLPNLC